MEDAAQLQCGIRAADHAMEELALGKPNSSQAHDLDQVVVGSSILKTLPTPTVDSITNRPR
jgi:hypothetical protein